MPDESGRKKIIHLRTSHGVFGAERVILGLLSSSDRDRYDVEVTLLGSEEGLSRQFADEIETQGFKVNKFLFEGRLDFKGVTKLRRYIKEGKYDLVHCHDFKSNFYGLLATLGTEVKRITTVHGSTVDSFLLWLYLSFNEYFLIRFFHRVVVVSDHLAEELTRNAISRKKIRVIPNGIDLSIFNGAKSTRQKESDLPIPSSGRVIGVVGRLFPDKGHEVLFKAAQHLKAKFHDITILIVGDGPHAEYLKKRRDEMGLESSIIFAGVRDEMGKVYSVIDLFVMPSIREGLPMSLLEAMLSMKPVVASRVGGIPSLLGDGNRGILVEPNNVEELVREIERLLLDPDEGMRMAKEASAFVRSEYSSDLMARRTEELYREVIKG